MYFNKVYIEKYLEVREYENKDTKSSRKRKKFFVIWDKHINNFAELMRKDVYTPIKFKNEFDANKALGSLIKCLC